MSDSPYLNAVVPHSEIGTDVGALIAYARAAEDLGFKYLVAYDHVVGADPASYPDRTLWHTKDDLFQEPLTLFSFLAGQTSRLGFSTGVVILPQRQTVLFAKQAANVDHYCAGRLRIGVGTGWNQIEYEALGENFENRGERFDEQINVLRQLWSEPVVHIETEHHTIKHAGVNPLPLQPVLPIWMGGSTGVARRRAAALGDGWMPNVGVFPGSDNGLLTRSQVIELVEAYQQDLRAAGRPLDAGGVETMTFLDRAAASEDWSLLKTCDVVAERMTTLKGISGFRGVTLDTHFRAPAPVDVHIDALARISSQV